MRFSIIIPAYKPKYLSQAVQSILNQTHTDFELIIVNDKSPQDIERVVKQFSDARISYFENPENLGKKSVVASWNNSMKYANEEYTLLFSDDDVLNKDFLLEMDNLIKKYPRVDVFYSRVAVIDSNSDIIRYTSAAPEYETCIDFIWHRVSEYREIYAQNFVFRTSALEEIDGFVEFPLAWGSDDATWFSLARRNGIVSTPKPLCQWRWSELNISNIGDFTLRLNAIEVFLKWVVDMVTAYAPVNEIEAELKRQSLQHIPGYKEMLKKSLMQRLLENNNKLTATLLFLKHKNEYKLPVYTFLKGILK